MPSSKNKLGFAQLRVGIFVLAGLALLMFLILNASGDFNPFKTKLHLRARFANAEGLRPGSDVYLAGVRVGQVEKIALLPNATNEPNAPRVEAQLKLDGTIDGQPANQRVRTDSTVLLTTAGLLSNDKLVNISPGTVAGSPASDYMLLAPSSTNASPLANLTGQEFSDQVNSLSKQLNEISQKINRGEGSVGKAINDEELYNNLNATVRDTQAVINQIRSGRGTAGQLLNDDRLYRNLEGVSAQLQEVSNQVRSGRGTVGKLVYDEELYRRINDVANRADRSIAEINNLVGEVRAGRGTIGKLVTDEQLYNDTRAALTDARAAITDARAAINGINPTVQRVDAIIAGAQRGEGTLGKFITDDQLYNNANQLTSEGVKIIYDFRQNPKKYLTIKLELF